MSAEYSIADLIAEVAEVQLEHLEWRAGQTYFNVLARQRRDLSERIRSGPLDPFYDDARIPSCLEFLVENWTIA